MESDIALLQRYADARDAQAFADLVKRYAGMVYGTCLRVTGNVHAAEDASQECFLQLARHAGGVRGSVTSWLHQTAVTRARMVQRAESRRRHREERAASMNGQSGPSDEPTWAEISPYVDDALAELPEDLRDPLICTFMQSKTQSEVAQELGVDQSTVSRRIEKGLDLFRAALKRKGVIVTSALLGTLLAANTTHAAPIALTAALGKMAMAGIGAEAVSSVAGGRSAAAGTATGATTFVGGVVMLKVVSVTVVVIGAIVAGILLFAGNSHEPQAADTEPLASLDALNTAPSAPSPAAAISKTPEELKLEALLDRKIAQITLPGVTLQEAVEILKAVLNEDALVIDPEMPENNPQVPANVEVRDATVREALDAMLRPCGWDFVIHDGAIFISTKERIATIRGGGETVAPTTTTVAP